MEIAPLVQEIGATSLGEIERLIGELQEAKDFLQSEGERVQRETERYTNFTQMASASVKIISDTVAGWREAGHPSRNLLRTSQLEVTPSPPEDDPGSVRVPDQQSRQSQGPIRGLPGGEGTPEIALGEEQSLATILRTVSQPL